MSHAQGMLAMDQVLTVGEKSYMVGPPQLVSGTAIYQALNISASGRYVCYTKMEVPGPKGIRGLFADLAAGKPPKQDKAPTGKLYVYDDRSGKSLPLWNNVDSQSYAQVSFLGESPLAILSIQIAEENIRNYVVSLSTAELKQIEVGEHAMLSRVDSKNQQAIFLDTSGPARKFILWNARGLTVLPEPPGKRWFMAFLPDGSGITTTALAGSNPASKDERIASMMVLDFRTMSYRGMKSSEYAPPPYEAHEPSFDVQGLTTKVGTLSYSGGDQKPTGAGEVRGGMQNTQVSADGSKVVFESNMCLFISDILSVDAKVLKQAQEAAERTRLLSNVKQIGLAVLIYGADNHDNLPGRDGFTNTLMPYAKNAAIFSGFVYSYSGPGNMGDIKEPASTELGYVTGPGGRAVVYADGHAKWIPDK